MAAQQSIGRYEEVRDAANNFFFEQLPAGEYTLKYRVRAATAGVSWSTATPPAGTCRPA